MVIIRVDAKIKISFPEIAFRTPDSEFHFLKIFVFVTNFLIDLVVNKTNAGVCILQLRLWMKSIPGQRITRSLTTVGYRW